MLLPSILYGAEAKNSPTYNDASIIYTALINGFQGIDSAAMLGIYAEQGAGSALEYSKLERNKLWLQSKFTPKLSDDQGTSLVYNLSAPIHDQVNQSFNWSLKSLKTEYLDSYLMHCPSDGIYAHISNKDLEIWKEFESLQSHGSVRQIGVADINLHSLKKLVETSKIKPAIVQNFAFVSNYGFPNTEAQTLEYCLENAIAYQPVQLLKERGHFLKHPKIIEIATKHGVTTGQILIKFAKLVGMNPVLGTSNPKHMQEALSLNFDLLEAEVRTITQLLPESNLMFSIYIRLQNGELITQHDIAEIIINSDPLNLDFSLNKVLKYIPKIDPATLAEIMKIVDIKIVEYLSENGARIDLIPTAEQTPINNDSSELAILSDTESNNFNELSNRDILDLLEKDLNNIGLLVGQRVNASKMFDAIAKMTNNMMYEGLIKQIQDGDLSKYWAEGIKLSSYFVIQDTLKKHPEIAHNLIKIGVSSGWVIEILSTLSNPSYFHNLINQIESADLDSFNIASILISQCKLEPNHSFPDLFLRLETSDFYANSLLRDEIYKIESLSNWQQQKEAINKFISCCQTEDPDLKLFFRLDPSSIISECYGQQNYESDEL